MSGTLKDSQISISPPLGSINSQNLENRPQDRNLPARYPEFKGLAICFDTEANS
jgi:hypothetical protein